MLAQEAWLALLVVALGIQLEPMEFVGLLALAQTWDLDVALHPLLLTPAAEYVKE